MGYSNWRQDLTEVMTDKEDDKKVTEKNIKNKIVINPKLGEAVEALGGELLEMVEMVKPEQEQSPQEKEKEDPKQKKISQVKKQVLMKKMQAVRQGAGADIVAHYEPEGEQIDEKKECAHNYKGEECPVHGKKECPAMVEELSIDQQMKISQEYNRKSPEEKRAANSKLLGAIKKVRREKDTRTDAQKMTDATGPRPGSRYRGD